MNKQSVNRDPVFVIFFECLDSEGTGYDDTYASYDSAMERVNEWAEEMIECEFDGKGARLYCVEIHEFVEKYAVLTEEQINRLPANNRVPEWIPEVIVIQETDPR
jgi:hypothetical protein